MSTARLVHLAGSSDHVAAVLRAERAASPVPVAAVLPLAEMLAELARELAAHVDATGIDPSEQHL